MKIEWLDSHRTRALVTKGWIWKCQAEVNRTKTYPFNTRLGMNDWNFVETGELCSRWMSVALERDRDKKSKRSPWRPIPKLPQAKIMEDDR